MKLIHLILFAFIPFFGFSQFGTHELYGYSRIGIGVGLTDINYSSNLNGNSINSPQTVKANIGGGFTTEIGLGLKVLEKFYIEPFVSYMFSTTRYHNEGQTINKFSSNRFNIGINGKYFVYINPEMNFELYGGTSYRVPQDMVIETSYGDERITYSSNVGVHAGFGFNYLMGDFVFNAGMRYRYEKYKLNTARGVPLYFNLINPDLNDLKISGIDIIFSVMYNFR